MIVARDDGENNFLEGYRKQFVHLRTESHEGPLTLIDGARRTADIELAARIAARYGQGRSADVVDVSAHHPNGVVEQLRVAPIPPHQIPDAGMSDTSQAPRRARLDTRGLICPLPVIRTQDRIKTLAAGTVLEIVATDPGAMHDIPAWCRVHGHEVARDAAARP